MYICMMIYIKSYIYIYIYDMYIYIYIHIYIYIYDIYDCQNSIPGIPHLILHWIFGVRGIPIVIP